MTQCIMQLGGSNMLTTDTRVLEIDIKVCRACRSKGLYDFDYFTSLVVDQEWIALNGTSLYGGVVAAFLQEIVLNARKRFEPCLVIVVSVEADGSG